MFVSLLKRKRLKLRSAYSYMPAKQKSFPSFFKTPHLLAVTRRGRGKTTSHIRCACQSTIVWHAFVYLVSVKQILKFHERVISALILVASFARPKISSQFLRVSGILKFVGSQLRGRYEKSVPLSPFLILQSPRTLEVHASVLHIT